MNILSGTTGKKVGTMDEAGNVKTANRELAAIMRRVLAAGSVIVPDRPVISKGDVISEKIKTIEVGSPQYANALRSYLLRQGFEVSGG